MTTPSEPPAPPPREEDKLFDIFGVLREHVVKVSAGFRQRLNQRLGTVHRNDRAHRFGDVFGSLFVEAFNLLGGSVGAADSRPEDDDDHK